MPKYFTFKVAGYYLYFTSHCIVEAMHVHASNRHLTESASAKFYVKANGDALVQQVGHLNEREINLLVAFIKANYQQMYLKWRQMSDQGFYGENQ